MSRPVNVTTVPHDPFYVDFKSNESPSMVVRENNHKSNVPTMALPAALECIAKVVKN